MAQLPKVSPASISFVSGTGENQVMDFPVVVFEEHTTKSQITKYPVQEGLHVSNHAIRNNRGVSIKAGVGNVRLVDERGDVIGRDYGELSTRSFKDAIDYLINEAVECTVLTNLGTYEPVIFNRFQTRQQAGMVDSMEFTLSGEEIIKIDTKVKSAPIPISFTEVTGAARDALVEELAKSKINVDDCDRLSQGSYNTDESFIIEALDAAGTAVETTFEFLGNDPVSGAAKYAQSVLGMDVASNVTRVAENEPCAEEGFLDSLTGGIKQASHCLLKEADTFVEGQVARHVETAMGELTQGLYGAFYDTITMDSSSGQILATAGLGCIIRGVTGTESEFPYMPGESLPTVNEILNGNIFSSSKKEVLTKIECDCSDQTQAEVDTSLLPI